MKQVKIFLQFCVYTRRRGVVHQTFVVYLIPAQYCTERRARIARGAAAERLLQLRLEEKQLDSLDSVVLTW